jgi:hypothetical protein
MRERAREGEIGRERGEKNLDEEARDLRASSAIDVEVDAPPEGKRRPSRHRGRGA